MMCLLRTACHLSCRASSARRHCLRSSSSSMSRSSLSCGSGQYASTSAKSLSSTRNTSWGHRTVLLLNKSRYWLSKSLALMLLFKKAWIRSVYFVSSDMENSGDVSHGTSRKTAPFFTCVLRDTRLLKHTGRFLGLNLRHGSVHRHLDES